MTHIILVHIGTQFPIYLNDCIEQLSKYDFKIHVIISKCVENDIIRNPKVIIANVEDHLDEQYHEYTRRNTNTDFRDGFWQSTSSRFIIIRNYSEKIKLQSFFHIEYDNIVFSSLENEREILEKSPYEMCVVMDGEDRCLPSIMWIRNPTILNPLVEIMLDNPFVADMYFLAAFYSRYKEITNFPILPSGFKVMKDDDKTECSVDFSNMFDEFRSVFDAISIGQYLSGIDPRNVPGNTIGHINETSVFNPTMFSYGLVNNELYMFYRDVAIKVNNIHVHSKNLRQFM